MAVIETVKYVKLSPVKNAEKARAHHQYVRELEFQIADIQKELMEVEEVADSEKDPEAIAAKKETLHNLEDELREGLNAMAKHRKMVKMFEDRLFKIEVVEGETQDSMFKM